MTADDPRIYVASLADYNAGRLYGRWIDLDGLDVADIQTEIADMLAGSPEAKNTGQPSEEWEIHDYEGLPAGVVANGLTVIAEWVTATEDLDTEDQRDAFLAYCDHVGWHYAARDFEAIVAEFEDAYLGTYSDAAEFAGEFLDMTYPELLEQVTAAGLTVDLRDAVAGWETDWLALEDVPGGVAAWRRV